MSALRCAAAVGHLRVAACAVAVSAGLVSAAHAASARLLEVGDRGRLSVSQPALARIEITTAERLAGAVVVELREEVRFRPGPGRLTLDLTRVCDSSHSQFALEAGESRVIGAYLPPLSGCRWYGEGLHARWRVVDETGRELGAGSQPVRIDTPHLRDRVLYLTNADVSVPRRAPEDAFDEALPYGEYAACVISGHDFASLNHGQKAALLDRTALGAALLITAPVASLSPELDEALADPDAVVWRDDAGHEAREARLHLGFVRTAEQPLERLAVPGPEAAPLPRLLTAVWPLRPVSHTSVAVLRDRLFDLAWRRSERLRPDDDGPSAALAMSLLGVAFLAAVLGSVWWASRARAATAARTLLAASLALAGAPGLLYLAGASSRAGNADVRWDVVYHDSSSRLQSRWTQERRGGGGGSDDPEIAFGAGPRAVWSAQRVEDGGLSLTQDLEGRFRLGLGRRGLTATRRISLSRTELESNEPLFDDVALEVREGRAVGRLRARHPLVHLAIVGPLGTARFGSGVAPFGAVRAGERLEVVRTSWRDLLDSRELAGPELLPSLAGTLGGGIGVWPRLAGDTYYAIAAEAAERPAGGAMEPGSVVAHIQLLPVAGAAAARGGIVGVPADREGGVLRMHVPEVTWVRMRRLGLALRPSELLLDESRTPEVSGAAVDGFRDVVFHLTGAPVPGPQRSEAGARMAVAVAGDPVLADASRWRAVGRP